MVPDGWEIYSVGEIARVIRGASPRPKGDLRYYEGNIPRLMVADVTRDGKYVIPKIDFLTEEGAKLSRMLPAGTLTIVCSGTVGIPSILAVDACIHDGFLALNEVSKKCDIGYLYYVFSRLQRDFDSVATHGGVFTNLTTNILKEFTIVLPVLSEQKKIAAVLSSVDDAIQATQAVIDQTRTVKQGLLQQLLTRGIGHTRFKQTEIGEIPEEWEAISLGDFGNFTNGINKGKEDFGFGVPFVNLQDVFGVNRISSLPKGLVNATQQEIQRYSLKAGDVLFVRSSVKPSGVGLTAAITDDIDDVVFSGFLIRYRQSKPKLTSKYMEYCFYEPSFRRRLLARSTVSANANINQKALEQLIVAIPSEVEQKQISSVLDSVDCTINQEQQKVAVLTEIKRGLMQDLLTGRVRVKLDEMNTT